MKNFALVGTLVGSIVFLLVGILPAMAYGGYAGLLLAGGLGFGEHLMAGFGMGLGAFGVGSLFCVLGAILGVGLQGLVYGATQSYGFLVSRFDVN